MFSRKTRGAGGNRRWSPDYGEDRTSDEVTDGNKPECGREAACSVVEPADNIGSDKAAGMAYGVDHSKTRRGRGVAENHGRDRPKNGIVRKEDAPAKNEQSYGNREV